jgi:hypothetical protein
MDNPVIDKSFPLKDTIKFSFDCNKYVPDKKTDVYVNFKSHN